MKNNENTASVPQNTAANGNNGESKKLGLKERFVRFWFYNNKHIRHWRAFFFGSIGVVLCAVVFPYFLRHVTHIKVISEMGPYGDVYGGLNTLFTGCAFVGLIITIFLQHQEMRETRKEFEQQTNLMLRQNVNACMFEQLKYMQNIKQDVVANYKQLLSNFDKNIDDVLNICKIMINSSEISLSKNQMESINELRRTLNVMNTWCSSFASWCMRINRVIGNSLEEVRSKDEYVHAYWDLITSNDKFMIFMQYVLYGAQEKEIQKQLISFFEDTPYIFNVLLIKGFDKQTFMLFYHLIHQMPHDKTYSIALEIKDVEDIFTRFKNHELSEVDLFEKNWESYNNNEDK